MSTECPDTEFLKRAVAHAVDRGGRPKAHPDDRPGVITDMVVDDPARLRTVSRDYVEAALRDQTIHAYSKKWGCTNISIITSLTCLHMLAGLLRKKSNSTYFGGVLAEFRPEDAERFDKVSEAVTRFAAPPLQGVKFADHCPWEPMSADEVAGIIRSALR